MGQQVTKRDGVPGLRRARQILADLVVHRQLAVLDQQHDGGGDELLAQRADLENGVGPGGDAVFDIGETVALDLDRDSVLDDRNRHGRHVLLLNPAPDEIIDVLTASCSGRDKHQRKGQKRAARTIHRHSDHYLPSCLRIRSSS